MVHQPMISTDTMKAAVRDRYVDFSEIEIRNIPIPDINEDEVLVKIHASTINRTGCALVNAKPFIMRFFIGFMKPKRLVLGTDFSGEVVKVGKSVDQYKVGDRVMGFRDEGLSTHAEYTAVSINQGMVHMPSNLNFIEAAACQEATHYAYNWIKDKKIDSTKTVLINGATGGIGTAITQFVSASGAQVTAVGNGKNIELLRKLGAHKIFNYEEENFLECDLRYDYIFDAVGKSTYGKCKHLLKAHGIYISSELGPWIQNPILALYTAKRKGKKVEFPLPSNIIESLHYVKQQVEEGRYKPVIEKVYYSFDEIGQAYQYVSEGMKTGNVVMAHVK